MKPIEQYADYDEYYAAGVEEGLSKTKEGRQFLFSSFDKEIDIRDAVERMIALIKKAGQVSKSEMYKKLRLDRLKPGVFDGAIDRIRSNEHVGIQIGLLRTTRGRKALVFIWIEVPDKTELTDERYKKLLAQAGLTGTEIITDAAKSEEPYTGSPNWVGPGGAPTVADSLDQLIDRRRASQQ